MLCPYKLFRAKALGAGGIEKIVPLKLSQAEEAMLEKSAAAVARTRDDLKM